MILEWDENKRLANMKKHGLDFKKVRVVFNDINKVMFQDVRKDYGEIRLITVGMYKDQLLTSVCHTERGIKTRIISFRPASKKEREVYYARKNS